MYAVSVSVYSFGWVHHSIPTDAIPTDFVPMKLLWSNVTSPNPTTNPIPNPIPKTLALSLLSVGITSVGIVSASRSCTNVSVIVC